VYVEHSVQKNASIVSYSRRSRKHSQRFILFDLSNIVRHFNKAVLHKPIAYRRKFFTSQVEVAVVLTLCSAGLGGPKGPGATTMFVCLAICTSCACHLVIFISEESLFVDAIKLSVVQTAVFHLNII